MCYALPVRCAHCAAPCCLPSRRFHHPFHFLSHNITRVCNFGPPPEPESKGNNYAGSSGTDSASDEEGSSYGGRSGTADDGESESSDIDSNGSKSHGAHARTDANRETLRAAAHAAIAELKIAAGVVETAAAPGAQEKEQGHVPAAVGLGAELAVVQPAEEGVSAVEEVQPAAEAAANGAAGAVGPPADVCGGTGKVCGDPACTACTSDRFFMSSSHMRPEVAGGYYHEPERCRCGGNHGYGLEWPVMYNNWRKRVEAKGGPLVRIVPHYVSGQYIGAKLIALVDFDIGDIICEVFGWVMRVWELLLYHRRDVRAGLVAGGLLPPFTYAMNDGYALSKPLRSVKAKATRGLVSEVLLATFFNVLCPLKYSFYLRVMVSLGQLELVHVVVPCLVRWLPAYPLSPFSL